MQLVIELDGPVVDVQRRHFQAHRLAQQEIGLAARLPDEFWRLYRKEAPLIEIVRPHRTGLLEVYQKRFAELRVSGELWSLDTPQSDAASALSELNTMGPCSLVVLGHDRQAAQELLDRHELWRFFRTMRMLSQDLSMRISQLKDLAAGGGQTLAALSSDVVTRSAREAGLIVAGVSNGPCTPLRLTRNGADLVVRNLSELVAVIREPTPDLLRAGFTG